MISGSTSSSGKGFLEDWLNDIHRINVISNDQNVKASSINLSFMGSGSLKV
ncbi:MAG: hypothetical protein V4687_03110 [Bacteroidota bacterium]